MEETGKVAVGVRLGGGRSDPLGIFSFSPHRDIHIVLFYKVAFLLLFIVDALTGLPTLKMKQQLG